MGLDLVVLVALGQSVIRTLPDSLYPTGQSPDRTRGYKWSLLKVRKGKHKWEHFGNRVESSGAYKTYDSLWEGENQVIPIQ
jgi:hypothetical protein